MRPIRVLIIEDDSKLVEDMKNALGNVSGRMPLLEMTYVPNAEDARAKLRQHRVHITSIDCLLSGGSQESYGYVATGMELAEDTSRLSRAIAYTGNVTAPGGMRFLDIAGERGIFYLQKGKPAPKEYPPQGNPYVWAACLLRLAGGQTDDRKGLEFIEEVEAAHPNLKPRLTPYFEAYWRDASSRLPEPLAREALVIHEAVTRGRFGVDHLLAANRFRLWTLVLARAQTGVLAASCALTWPNDLPIAKDEDEAARLHLEPLFECSEVGLETLWDAWPSWLSHLGGFKVGGALALGPQARILRTLRNEQVHSLKAARSLQHDLDALREPLMALMDAAAYWADFPWFMNLRFEGGRWSGLVPRGYSASQWRTHHLPDNLVRKFSGGRSSDDRIHQVQWRRISSTTTASEADDKFAPELVDAWPWLRRYRAADGSDTVLALWYPIRKEKVGRTLWQAYTYSGQAVQIPVAESDWQAKP